MTDSCSHETFKVVGKAGASELWKYEVEEAAIKLMSGTFDIHEPNLAIITTDPVKVKLHRHQLHRSKTTLDQAKASKPKVCQLVLQLW